MNHSDAVHTPSICYQGGAKCRQTVKSSNPSFSSRTTPRPAVLRRFSLSLLLHLDYIPFPARSEAAICGARRPRLGRRGTWHLASLCLDKHRPPRRCRRLMPRHAAQMDGRVPHLSHTVKTQYRSAVLASTRGHLTPCIRRWARRRDFVLPWDVPNAADLARRRMGA